VAVIAKRAAPVIARVWHGWTTPANADAYERLLREEVLPGIEAMEIEGYHGVDLLRRAHRDEVEFVTIMRFDGLDAVRAFAGEDYEVAYVPDGARALLERWDPRSAHFQLRERRDRP
jgi:antibiotic biosynthesis monooxygenase (ABM) superfamily enzyme